MPDEMTHAVEPKVKAIKADSRSEKPSGRDDTAKLVTVANLALVGVPSAYAVTQSVLVTLFAAVAAVILACLVRWRR